MSWQDIAIGLLTVGSGGAGWFLRQIWEAVTELKRDIHILETDMRTNFARRDDVREMFQQLLGEVRSLREVMSSKADK